MNLRSMTTALVLVSALAGCKTTLDLEYAFVLEQGDNAGTLTYSDERFSFAFVAVPSGVWFQITNNADESAYLDWSNTFFVMPSGNVFNALNTEILDESNEVAMRSLHRTQVPRGATVSRFTTATVNTEEKNLVVASEVGTTLTTTNVQWNLGGGYTWTPEAQVRNSANYARTLTVANLEYWSAWRFWPSTITSRKGHELKELDRLAALINSEEPMGLGIRLAFGDTCRDYRFDFPMTAVFASALQSVAGEGGGDPSTFGATRTKKKKERVLLYTLRVGEGAEWKQHDSDQLVVAPESVEGDGNSDADVEVAPSAGESVDTGMSMGDAFDTVGNPAGTQTVDVDPGEPKGGA